ncbi:Uncharacterized protein family UPF0102 [Coriobacterium glomerans PW2]|uniref:UPF0102 protein Corgl_0879 n=1 Tax=Coriobacterium glomerans (strain ATCC 49209 / DSM 20642 / JCM 10262 / PW2) TaxID=700015 RepID=F2N9G3_CORGP|nr:YraN family protein [Coriobacterium glomerans]AEB06992.1 Uncharacterized protein family UPF0102 [Coriobacterium glomerans PW2]
MHATDRNGVTASAEGDEITRKRCHAPAETDSSLLDGLTPHELGRVGELIVASYLEERGYEILERGYRCREGEADLIARDAVEDEIVLVEVKTRRRGRADATICPEDAVDARKRRRYRRIAACYVQQRTEERAIRFDVVSVTVSPGNVADIMHIFDAFDGGDRR